MPSTLNMVSNTPSAFSKPSVKGPTPRNRPVRVCFLIDELTKAGTETQLVALIRRLDRGRVQPHLCLLRGESDRSRALEPTGCPGLRLGVGSLKSPATLGKVWRLIRFLQQQRIDVLQVYFPESTYVGIPAGWLAGVPHLIRTRNNLGYWVTPMHRRLSRICNYFTDKLIANCEACKEAVVADESFLADRVVVLENGVDLARFPIREEKRVPGKEIRVGVVANLRPVKGLDVFVRAASLLAAWNPDVSFHIAGDGELRRRLQQMAAERGFADRLVLHGSVADVPEFLAELDIAVLPSRSEGMSNALLEYMAAGKAIVATAVGGNTRLLNDGIHGLLVPPDDPAQLAGAIARLLRDHDLASRLAGNARRRVEKRYSRTAMVRRFEDFYEDLLRSGPERKGLRGASCCGF